MVNIKILAILALTAVVANLSEPVEAWGEEGHRAVARIGYSLLTPKAKAAFDELLKAGNYTLDSAATWPDTIRKTIPKYSTSGEWHYIDAHDNPPEGNCAAVAYPGDCPEGRCIISALAKAAYVLADTKAALAKRYVKTRPTFDKFGRPIPQLPEDQTAEQQHQYLPEEQQQSVYPNAPKTVDAEEPVAKEPETKQPEQPAVVVGKHKKKCRPRRKHTAAVVVVEPTQGLEPTKVAEVPSKPGKQTQVVVDERATESLHTPTYIAEQPAPVVPQPTQLCEQPAVIVPKPGNPQEPTQVVVDAPSKPTKPTTGVEPKPEEPKPPEEPKSDQPIKTQVAEPQQPTEPFEGDQYQGPHQGEPTATSARVEDQCITTYYYGNPGKKSKTVIATTTCGGGASGTVVPTSSAIPTTSAAQSTTATTSSASETTTSTSVASTTTLSTPSTAITTTTITTTATATPTPNPNEPHPIINIGSKAEALSFLIHFSGDISQPEHTSGYLRGGNGFNVTVNGKRSNLHSAWDGAFIRESIAKDFGGKWEAWVDHLQKQALTADEAANVACGSKLTGTDIGATEKCTLDWAQDTVQFVCGSVFVGIKDGEEVLGGEYYKRSLEVTNRQILKGGHRMAAVLNKLLGQNMSV